jgi:hypothetical protein
MADGLLSRRKPSEAALGLGQPDARTLDRAA